MWPRKVNLFLSWSTWNLALAMDRQKWAVWLFVCTCPHRGGIGNGRQLYSELGITEINFKSCCLTGARRILRDGILNIIIQTPQFHRWGTNASETESNLYKVTEEMLVALLGLKAKSPDTQHRGFFFYTSTEFSWLLSYKDTVWAWFLTLWFKVSVFLNIAHYSSLPEVSV